MTTYFKIALFEGSNGLCDSIALMALKANGGRKITLNEMYIVAEGNKLQYPTLNDDITVCLVDDTRLHIDKKVGEGWKTVLIIQQIETAELASIDDLKGICEPN